MCPRALFSQMMSVTDGFRRRGAGRGRDGRASREAASQALVASAPVHGHLQLSDGAEYHSRTNQAEVEQVAHVQDEVMVESLLDDLSSVNFNKHAASKRDLAVSDESVIHDMQVPHLHQFLFTFIHISKLVNHMSRLYLQPLRIIFTFAVILYFLRSNG